MSYLVEFVLLAICMPVSELEEPKSLVPEKAFVVFTRESWGCLNGQEIKKDVTSSFSIATPSQVTIESLENPDDVNNRNELYLFFNAKTIIGVRGFLVAKLWCDRDPGLGLSTVGVITVNVTTQPGIPPTIGLRLTGNANVFVELGYARSATLQHALVTCRESGLHEPFSLSFFAEYSLEMEKKQIRVRTRSDEWHEYYLPLDSLVLTSAKSIAKCIRVLEGLSTGCGLTGSPYLWKREMVTVEQVEQTVRATIGPHARICFKLMADDGITTMVGGLDFVPQLRQKMALRGAKGELVGAEVWISISDPGH
jgi:hypothetical protein